MSGESQRLGRWIDHDGRGFPAPVFAFAKRAGFRKVDVRFRGHGLVDTPLQQFDGFVDPDHPGWTWRRKYGLCGPWVASNPRYPRIIAFKFVQAPKASDVAFGQIKLLRQIAAGTRVPDGREGLGRPVEAGE